MKTIPYVTLAAVVCLSRWSRWSQGLSRLRVRQTQVSPLGGSTILISSSVTGERITSA